MIPVEHRNLYVCVNLRFTPKTFYWLRLQDGTQMLVMLCTDSFLLVQQYPCLTLISYVICLRLWLVSCLFVWSNEVQLVSSAKNFSHIVYMQRFAFRFCFVLLLLYVFVSWAYVMLFYLVFCCVDELAFMCLLCVIARVGAQRWRASSVKFTVGCNCSLSMLCLLNT